MGIMLRTHLIVIWFIIFSSLNLVLANEGNIEEKKLSLKPIKFQQFIKRINDDKQFNLADVEIVNSILNDAYVVNPQINKANILEIGISQNNRIDLFSNLGFKNIWAIDTDKSALEAIKSLDPDVNVKLMDINKINDEFVEEFFSFVYLENTASENKDIPLFLQRINNITSIGGIIVIIDYTVKEDSISKSIDTPYGEKFYPLKAENIKTFLSYIGFEIMKFEDLSEKHLNTCKKLIDTISTNKKLLTTSNEFTDEEVQLISDYLNKIREYLEQKQLNVTLIMARKKE